MTVQKRLKLLIIPALLMAFAGLPALADDDPKDGTVLEIYGFAMLDMTYQTKQSDPAWFDALRVTRLPSYENEFGTDGHFNASVQQSRLGFRANTPTRLGELKTILEIDLFGVGVDAGQTTLRLREAYGELGQFGAGQTKSPFMDVDLFPNSLEYWGPTGMVFFRNVQVRWMPIQGDTRMTIALERPGASADQGDYADRIELQGVRARFPYPDLSAEYRYGGDWGYVEIAGIVRYMKWEDTVPDAIDLSGDGTGWGVNLSSNLKFGKSVLRVGAVYGEGIQNYMNDAPADIGVRSNPGNPVRPIEGELLPILGVTAFLDINWSGKASSTIGYSMTDIDNSDGQPPNAYRRGDYALANILFYPIENVMYGFEVQWGRRENNSDGFSSDDLKFQFSARYNFSKKFGGQ